MSAANTLLLQKAAITLLAAGSRRQEEPQDSFANLQKDVSQRLITLGVSTGDILAVTQVLDLVRCQTEYVQTQETSHLQSEGVQKLSKIEILSAQIRQISQRAFVTTEDLVSTRDGEGSSLESPLAISETQWNSIYELSSHLKRDLEDIFVLNRAGKRILRQKRLERLLVEDKQYIRETLVRMNRFQGVVLLIDLFEIEKSIVGKDPDLSLKSPPPDIYKRDAYTFLTSRIKTLKAILRDNLHVSDFLKIDIKQPEESTEGNLPVPDISVSHTFQTLQNPTAGELKTIIQGTLGISAMPLAQDGPIQDIHQTLPQSSPSQSLDTSIQGIYVEGINPRSITYVGREVIFPDTTDYIDSQSLEISCSMRAYLLQDGDLHSLHVSLGDESPVYIFVFSPDGMLQEEYLYISGHGSTSQEYREKIGVFPVKLRDERNGFLFTDSNRTPILTEMKLDLTKNPPYEAPITQERQGNLSNGMPYIHFYSKILGFLKESESCLFVKTSTGLRYFGYPLMEPFPGYEESHKGVIALPVETQQTHTSLVYIKYPPDSNSGKSALLDVQTGQVLYCARDYQTYEQLYDMGVTLIGNTSMITRIPDYHTLAIMESYLLPVYDHGGDIAAFIDSDSIGKSFGGHLIPMPGGIEPRYIERTSLGYSFRKIPTSSSVSVGRDIEFAVFQGIQRIVGSIGGYSMPYYVITLVKKVKIFRSNEIEYLYIGRHQDLDLAKSRGHIPANIKDSTLYMDFLISENQGKSAEDGRPVDPIDFELWMDHVNSIIQYKHSGRKARMFPKKYIQKRIGWKPLQNF